MKDCRKEYHQNGVTGRLERSSIHLFLKDNNRCKCGHERWEKRSNCVLTNQTKPRTGRIKRRRSSIIKIDR